MVRSCYDPENDLYAESGFERCDNPKSKKIIRWNNDGFLTADDLIVAGYKVNFLGLSDAFDSNGRLIKSNSYAVTPPNSNLTFAAYSMGDEYCVCECFNYYPLVE